MPNKFDDLIQRALNQETENNAAAYGVEIIPAVVSPGEKCWKVILAYHLTSEENNGMHNAFIEARDENGNRVQGVQIGWEWAGMRPEEKPAPLILDKPDNETANLPIQANFEEVHLWVKSAPSDKIIGLRSTHPDEPPGNTWGHHSFFILFQHVVMQDEAPPDPDPQPEPTPDIDIEGIRILLEQAREDMEASMNKIDVALEELGDA